MTKVVIDREGCISCGTCWEDCPDFFEENPDDNLSLIVENWGRARHRMNYVIDASNACPAEVIHVT